MVQLGASGRAAGATPALSRTRQNHHPQPHNPHNPTTPQPQQRQNANNPNNPNNWAFGSQSFEPNPRGTPSLLWLHTEQTAAQGVPAVEESDGSAPCCGMSTVTHHCFDKVDTASHQDQEGVNETNYTATIWETAPSTEPSTQHFGQDDVTACRSSIVGGSTARPSRSEFRLQVCVRLPPRRTRW